MPTVYSPPVSTYVPLASIELTATDSEIVFSSIPATYRDLIVVFDGTQSNTGATHDVRRYFNGDTTSGNYSSVSAQGFSSSANSFTDPSPFLVNITGGSRTQFIHQVLDYSATDKHKSELVRWNRGTTNIFMTAARWASTAQVTSITYSLNSGAFTVGSTFSLFGIAS